MKAPQSSAPRAWISLKDIRPHEWEEVRAVAYKLTPKFGGDAMKASIYAFVMAMNAGNLASTSIEEEVADGGIIASSD